MRKVRVQTEVFDPGEELSRFQAAQDGAGAVVSFSGLVRDHPGGGLVAMEIEHYPAMTKAALTRIVLDAQERWPLTGAMVIHRYGRLGLGDVIMMVATASAHRLAAFEAADYLMDYLKSRAPFWKKEIIGDRAEWVAAKPEDEVSLDRWSS